MKELTFIDMIGQQIQVQNKPSLTIVSLVPSQTELLYDLGLGKQVIGQTKFCIHPAKEYNSEKFIGGTKRLNLEKIKALDPDIIIANKEENEQSQIVQLQDQFPVWVSDVSTLLDNQKMITSLGEIFKVKDQAQLINQQINISFQLLKSKQVTNATCLYLIWKDPYMSVGNDTFIHQILTEGGFQNVITNQRYPEIDVEQMAELSPKFVFLSSEPFPFKQKHIQELETILPNSKVILVDGEMFSWYGSRVAKAPAYLMNLKRLNSNYA